LGAKPLVILIVCGVVFSLVYLGAVLLLGVLTAEETEMVRRKARVVIPSLSR